MLGKSRKRDMPEKGPRRDALSHAGLIRLASPNRSVALILAPGEHVRTTIVDLPIRARRKRQAAAGFALEEGIAAPLDSVEVMLGDSTGADRWLAATVDRDRLGGWQRAIAEAGIRRARLIPDYMLLERPERSDAWTVLHREGRMTVRREDGTGFAAPVATFLLAWRMAGRPRLIAGGDALPADIPAERTLTGQRVLSRSPHAGGLNLTLASQPEQESNGMPGWARAAAIVLFAGAAAHGALGWAETRELKAQAEERRAELEALARPRYRIARSAGRTAEYGGDGTARGRFPRYLRPDSIGPVTDGGGRFHRRTGLERAIGGARPRSRHRRPADPATGGNDAGKGRTCAIRGRGNLGGGGDGSAGQRRIGCHAMRISTRERTLILVAGAAAILAAGYAFWWEPQAQERARARLEIERMDRMSARLEAVGEAGMPALPPAPRNLTAIIAETARARDIAIRRLEPEGELARLTLQEAEFDALMGWLSELETDHAVQIAAIEIERRPEPGVVLARITLRR
jgi:type II secretory pathway component PulM